MAKGDRVRITTGSLQENDTLVFVYGVKLDQSGSPIRAFDGTVQVESLGGVKCGTTGVILGPTEKVHRSQLKDHDTPPGLGTRDYVEMIPVLLDYYQQVGWFPTNNTRIV
jgi:hypothetical protein